MRPFQMWPDEQRIPSGPKGPIPAKSFIERVRDVLERPDATDLEILDEVCRLRNVERAIRTLRALASSLEERSLREEVASLQETNRMLDVLLQDRTPRGRR